MIYEVEGTTRNISRKHLDKVLYFAQSYLGIKETAFLTVRFSKDFNEDQCGYCDEVDIDEEWVELEINKGLDAKTMVETILHEMVHVKQILDGRLVQGNPSTWNGVEYDGNYNELPWEIEAYRIEEQMAREFNNE